MNNAGIASVGVVITCYNYERYVGAAIDSVLSQSWPAAEIIVIDDGSTDGSAQVIRAYGDAVTPVFQTNAGKVEAVNIGFARSTADIILFLDADDLLLDGALEAVITAWTQDTVKVQFDLEIINSAGERLGRRFCNFPEPYGPSEVRAAFEKTGTYLWPVTSGNAYARRFLERLLPMTPPVSQDGVLNTIAPLYGDVVTLTRALGQYRLHGLNKSRQDLQGKTKRYPDFGRRIRFRAEEFGILQDHAAKLGVQLNVGEPLDNELVFVNYKLMALKLGDTYPGSDRDSPYALCGRAMRLSWRAGSSINSSIAALVWAGALFISPPSIAEQLIVLRFNRAELFKPLRRFFSSQYLARDRFIR